MQINGMVRRFRMDEVRKRTGSMKGEEKWTIN